MKFPVLLSRSLLPPYLIFNSHSYSCADNAKQIKLVLDEVAAKGKEVIFKRDVYADVYVDILGLMVKCDMTPIHQAKTKALCVQWAKMGSKCSLIQTILANESFHQERRCHNHDNQL